MHSRLLPAIAAALILALPPLAALAAEPPAAIAPDDRQAIQQIHAGLRVVSGQAEKAWPGFDLKAIPFILHRPGGPAFLLQHPVPLPPGFMALAGHPAIAVQPESSGYPVGIDTEFKLGSRRAVTVMRESDQSWQQTLVTAVHEAFHQYQHDKKFAVRGSSQSLNVHSARDMALAETEQLLLADALDATAVPRAKQFARMALAVRATRHGYLPEAIARTELTLESLEGTAHYFELQAQLLASEQGTGTFGRPRPALLAELSSWLRQPLTPNQFGRWRYYKTGGAMGFLLDRWMPDWKRRAEQDRAPAELLGTAAGYQGSQKSVLMGAVEGRYDLAAATRRYQAQFDEVKQRQAAALAAFDRQPGWKLVVEIPFEVGGISTSTQGLNFPLPDDADYSEQATISVETPSTSVLVSGEMIGRPISEGPSGYYTYTVYLPIQPGEIRLNGRPLALTPGRYTGSLQWSNPRATIRSPRATLDISGDQVRIRL